MNGRKCGRDGMWMIEASSGVVLCFVLFFFLPLVDTLIAVVSSRNFLGSNKFWRV